VRVAVAKFFCKLPIATTAAERLSGQRRSRKSSIRGRNKRKKIGPSLSEFLHPTHVLLNGNILTLDPAQPSAEAVAILGDRVAAIGTNDQASALAGPGTVVTDLKGATVVPGFVDCHTHLLDFGLSLGNIILDGVRSIEEMKKRVAERAADGSGWILGRGWDQERFAENRYPTRHDLDEVSPERPVFLRRTCGHICVVNSLALKGSGITAQTPDPPGGMIDRDQSGEPTGILRENAVDIVEETVPSPPLECYEEATLKACQIALAAGLTMVHCMISSELQLRVLLKLKREGRLPLRFYIFIPAGLLKTAIQLGLGSGLGDEWLRLGGVKIIADGSLGARTAGLEAPYSDDPLNRGILTYTQEQLDQMVAEAHRYDFQLAIHAIGDRAAKMALEAIEKATSWIPKQDMRHRIEHASVLSPHLIERLSEMKIIASVQPHFIVSDFWLKRRLGPERARFTYPISTLHNAGVTVVGGSDSPVDPLAPLLGIAAAIDRPDPDEAITVGDAIALYTSNAALASFDEKVRGTIALGKFADLVVLDKDPRKVSKSDIGKIMVLMTMIGGKIAYRSEAS